MEVVQFRLLATYGKPVAVGHLGTVTLSEPNEDGEIMVDFVLRRRGSRYLGLDFPPVLDKRRRKPQNDQNLSGG